jgi:hypothetical protein
VAADALAAAVLLALSSVWLADSQFAGPEAVTIQTALIYVLAVRRVWPSGVLSLRARSHLPSGC